MMSVQQQTPGANASRQAGERKSVDVLIGDLSGLDKLSTDSVAVFVWSDERPLSGVAGYVDWRLCGALSRALLSNNFSGERGERMLLPARGRFGPKRIVVVGLGPSAQRGAELFRSMATEAVDMLAGTKASEIVLVAPSLRNTPEVERAFVRAVEDAIPTPVKVLVEYAE